MMKPIRSIRIDFEQPVELPGRLQQAITDIASVICADYQAAHPDRVMWAAGVGALLTVHPLAISEDEPLPFDEEVFHVECMERQRYETDRSPPAGTLNTLCCAIADRVVPAYRDGQRSYSCGSWTGKRWEAAYEAARLALGGDPEGALK